MSIKIVDPRAYLEARDRAPLPNAVPVCTPRNIRVLANSPATCFLAEDGSRGFYLMPGEVRPRGDFGAP